MAALLPVIHDALANWVLGHRGEFTEAMNATDAAIARSEQGRTPLDEAEADDELGAARDDAGTPWCFGSSPALLAGPGRRSSRRAFPPR